jgi:hypothetical protein
MPDAPPKPTTPTRRGRQESDLRFNHLLPHAGGRARRCRRPGPGARLAAKKDWWPRCSQLQQPGIERRRPQLVSARMQVMQQAGTRASNAWPPRSAKPWPRRSRPMPQVRRRRLPARARPRGQARAGDHLGRRSKKFSEDELKQLIAWLESPVNKKFQAAAATCRTRARQKLMPTQAATLEPEAADPGAKGARRARRSGGHGEAKPGAKPAAGREQ